ncbi:MAG: S41 family peptidase, partial [Thermotogaceae bacterium]|nr:S41 family peptidase [Thermotogaceae bacterium]
MKRNTKKFIQYVLIAVIALSTGWILSAATNSSQNDTLRLITPIYETIQYITKYYYDKDSLDYEKLVDYGIDGLLKSLDKFSHYISPKMLEEEEIEMKGEYGGLGMEVTWDKEMEAIEVVAPMYGTPAWRKGIRSGDRIIEIDGTPTSEMTYMEAVKNLRGLPGTKVKLKIYREGVKEPIELEVMREKITIIPVKYATFESNTGRIGYIKITKFMETTYDDLKEAVNMVLSKNVKALILDLRDNPGGYLDQAVLVSSMFIQKGIIVKIRDTFGDEQAYEINDKVISVVGTTSSKTFRKIDEQVPTDLPLIVLVNNGSASASEIVTGAIKDHERGIVVGQKTFGKGSVQSGIMLSNGGMLYLTTAHYLTPSGRDIHGQGIIPNVEVRLKAASTEEESESEIKASESEKVLDYTKKEIQITPEKDPYI